MPKTTFYNLPQEKKDKLFAAARKEFSRTSFDEASINRIIQDAEISRGSFYTYFEDKKDLAYCILDEYAEQLLNKIRKVLHESDGDIFALYVTLFDFTVEYSTIRDDIAIFRNLFISIRSDREEAFREMCAAHKQRFHPDELIALINTEPLNVRGKEDLRDLLSILFPVAKSSILQALKDIKNAPEIRKRFLNKLKIIQYGALKERNCPDAKNI